MFKFADIMALIWICIFALFSIFTNYKIAWVFFGASVLWQIASYVVNELQKPIIITIQKDK